MIFTRNAERYEVGDGWIVGELVVWHLDDDGKRLGGVVHSIPFTWELA